MVAICITLLTPAPSRAGNRALAVALEYSAAPDCPAEAEFKGIVNGRLGYDAFQENAPKRVIAQIASRGRAYEGHIEWRDAAGQWRGDRTFPSRSNDCRELVRAMGFALALQIELLPVAETTPVAGEAPPPKNDGNVEAPSPAGVPSKNPAPPKPESAAMLAAAAPSHPAVPSPTHAYSLGVGGWVASGMSSNLVAFGRVFGIVAWPFLDIELAAEAGPPATIRRQDGAGFTHQELLASLAGCGTTGRWSGCLLVKGGAIRVAGRDIDDPKVRYGPFVQTGLRLSMTQALGRRAFAVLKAEALVTVTRPQVTLDQILVWTSPRFAGTLGLDVGVRFQ